MEFPRKNSVFGQFPLKFPPPPTPSKTQILLILSFRRLEEFRVFEIYLFLLGGFWDSVGRGARRGFRKYLSSGYYFCNSFLASLTY